MKETTKLHNCHLFKSLTLLIIFYFLLIGSSQIIQTNTNTSQNQLIENDQEKKITNDFPDFDTFVEKYQKNYQKGSPQYEKRKQIYEQRVQKLLKIQQNPNVTHQICVNRFSDLSQQQRQNRKSLLTIPQQKKQIPLLQTMGMTIGSIGAPSSLDWRNQGIVTAVKDQGTCGSCWTFATCAYGESRLVQQKLAPLSVSLSEQYLLTCTKQCTCKGGYLQYVFEKAADGVPSSSDYPYHPYIPSSPFMCWTNNKIHFGYIPEKYYNIGDQELISLLQRGTVAISLSGNNWEDYKGGIFRCNSYDKVNHAVLLVGYTPDYWIVKNQWGRDWGQNGYMRITRNPIYNCKIGSSAFVMWESIQHLTVYLLLLLMVLVLN